MTTGGTKRPGKRFTFKDGVKLYKDTLNRDNFFIYDNKRKAQTGVCESNGESSGECAGDGKPDESNGSVGSDCRF